MFEYDGYKVNFGRKYIQIALKQSVFAQKIDWALVREIELVKARDTRTYFYVCYLMPVAKAFNSLRTEETRFLQNKSRLCNAI